MLVIHTREGHLPDLSDAPPAKVERGKPSLRIGDPGPMGRILIRGEAGHDIIAELYPHPGEIVIELVSGRDASANFDMQSLASLMIGDQITVEQSSHKVRFLHPQGWNYFDTLRKKLHWNEGAA